MSASVMALLGVALFEATETTCSPTDRYRTLSLLARATEGSAIALALRGSDLAVNGQRLPIEAPGATIIQALFRRHGIGHLQLPAAIGPTHWEGVVDLLSQPPGSFPTLAELRTALHRFLPLAEPSPLETETADTIGAPVTPSPAPMTIANDPVGALHRAAETAVRQRDAATLADVLLTWDASLADGDNEQHRELVERRTALLASETLAWLVESATKDDPSGRIAAAIGTLGDLAIDPVLQAMTSATTGRERDVLAALLGPIPHLGQALLSALRGSHPALVVAATEVAGRHRLVDTIPPLAALLRSPDATIRTTAWHALEAIGTREAIQALQLRSR